MLDSSFVSLCAITLPWLGRQKYMHSFDLSRPVMPSGFEDYLDSVSALCRAAQARTGVAHMTVDEKVVPAGRSQRRPGPHVDGCFLVDRMSWGHEPGPYWAHYCNNITASPIPRMSVIVAASVAGCRAWTGSFDGAPKPDGDLSHILDQLGDGTLLDANTGYLLSPDCVHESVIFESAMRRTFLRIALPV